MKTPIAVIPRKTDDWLNSTNGFTIGETYPIISYNDYGSATVLNDNGHERCVGLDEGNNAHLQYRPVVESYPNRERCAGYFEVVWEVEL